MRAILALMVTVSVVSCLAQDWTPPDWTLPVSSILPEDIEQGSVQMVRVSTNLFAVRFTHTISGAKKLLAFEREHAGQEVIIVVGSFQRRTRIASPEMKIPGWTEAGYLKRRTNKIYGVSADDAKKIIESLTKR